VFKFDDLSLTKFAYSKAEAAKMISVSLRTIDNLIAQKELTARKIGRRVVVPHSSIVALLRSDSRTTQGVA
jgi:excisionase family DNA binding protein